MQFTHNKLLPICATNIQVLWTKVYDLVPSISLENNTNIGKMNFYRQVTSDVLENVHCYPRESHTLENNWSTLEEIICTGHHEQFQNAQTIPDLHDITTAIINPFIKFVTKKVVIPLHLFTHAFVERNKATMLRRSYLYETVTQQLKNKELHLIKHEHGCQHIRGDNHVVRLYCNVCQKYFGDEGQIIYVMAYA